MHFLPGPFIFLFPTDQASFAGLAWLELCCSNGGRGDLS